jgi:hypothetical protein
MGLGLRRGYLGYPDRNDNPSINKLIARHHLARHRRDCWLAPKPNRQGLRPRAYRQHRGRHCRRRRCRLAVAVDRICSRRRHIRGNRQRRHRGSDSLACDRSLQKGNLKSHHCLTVIVIRTPPFRYGRGHRLRPPKGERRNITRQS